MAWKMFVKGKISAFPAGGGKKGPPDLGPGAPSLSKNLRGRGRAWFRAGELEGAAARLE